MLEPGSPDPVVDGARRELAEELGVELSMHDLAHRATLLGVAHDLLRLRPEICLRLDLDAAESAQIRDRRPPSEFASVERVGLRGLSNFLESSAAADLTPAGAGALALAAHA
jgi:8-oxo-dGTP pyrophosphatase MutT (NUDIX family)